MLFCCHRGRRKDALDERGEPLDDVVMFRVADLGAKEEVLSDPGSPFFTTRHFDGYPAVLLRLAHLRRLRRDELEEHVLDAWLAKAPKKVAREWLADHGPPRSDR